MFHAWLLVTNRNICTYMYKRKKNSKKEEKTMNSDRDDAWRKFLFIYSFLFIGISESLDHNRQIIYIYVFTSPFSFYEYILQYIQYFFALPLLFFFWSLLNDIITIRKKYCGYIEVTKCKEKRNLIKVTKKQSNIFASEK